MDALFPYILAAGLFFVLEMLWLPESPAPGHSAAGRWDDGLSEWDPSTLTHLRDRLDALAEEKERLEEDPTVYARAFRYSVCRIAEAAVLTDLDEFAARYDPANDAHLPGPRLEPDLLTLELRSTWSHAAGWEEIDV